MHPPLDLALLDRPVLTRRLGGNANVF